MYSKLWNRVPLVVMAALAAIPVSRASAATQSWKPSPPNDDFSLGSNWVSGIAQGTGDTAPFNGTSTQTTLTISSATQQLGSVTFDQTAPLGVSTSSARFKEAIKPMDKASETLLALKPVTFRYKEDLDPDGIPQFGLVAEQVEKVNPDLVIRDEEGKAYTVRYEAVNAILLNEFLKEHRKVEEQDRKLQQQEATIGQLKSTVAKQEASIAQQQTWVETVMARLGEQESRIQKVSAELALRKPAPQTVLNNR